MSSPQKPARPAPSSGSKLPFATPISFDRLEKDVQTKEPLSIGQELVSFLRLYFGDGLDGGAASQGSMAIAVSSSSSSGDARRTVTDPEVGRYSVQVVWVENAKTGQLVPVQLRTADDGANDNNQDNDDGPHHDEDASILIMPPPLRNDQSAHGQSAKFPNDEILAADNNTSTIVSQFVKMAFFTCHALLAVFSFSSILIQKSSTSDYRFVVDYQPLASEYRRIFHIVSCLSAVGSIDIFMSNLSKTNKPSLGDHSSHTFGRTMVLRENRGSVTIAAAAALLHLITFILTIIMSAFDVLLATKNGNSASLTNTWAVEALATASFSSAFNTWKNLDTGRLICAVLGWFLCASLIWKELLSIDTRGKGLIKLKNVALAWKKRCMQLQGDESIEDLDTLSLKKLIALQTTGYEKANVALRLQEDLRMG